jgi:hypothetical protein
MRARARLPVHRFGSRSGVIAALAVAALAVAAVSATAAGHLFATTTDGQTIHAFEDMADTGGDAWLTRTPGMVLLTAEAAGLEPGDAYTVWWVVFNAPESCSDGVCGEDDLIDPDTGELDPVAIATARVGLGHATGNVARANGTTEFGARLVRGDDRDHEVLFPAGMTGDSVLEVAGEDAEVHIVLQGHGRGRGGPQLLDQLGAFMTSCTPACADLQFAVFLP